MENVRPDSRRRLDDVRLIIISVSSSGFPERNGLRLQARRIQEILIGGGMNTAIQYRRMLCVALLTMVFIVGGYAQNNDLQFNGTTNYASIPASPDWAFGLGDFTVEWWQYQTDNNAYPRIFAVGIYPVRAIGVSIENSSMWVWLGEGGYVEVPVGAIKNTWVHFAVTRAGSTVTVYKDGTAIGDGTDNSNIFESSAPLLLGKEDEVTYYGGHLDEFRMWNFARTQDEIRTTMRKELTGSETGLVVYYRMSDGSGGSLTDNAGHDHTGSLVGTSWATSSLSLIQLVNNCLHFDGVDDLVNMGNITACNNATTLTIEMWVNIETWDIWKTFFSKYDAEFGRIQFQLFSNTGDLGVIVQDGGSPGGYGYTTTQPVYTGEWFHLAMVFDGSGLTDADKLKLYINGVPQELSYIVPGVPESTPSTPAPVLLGAETVDYPYGFSGTMDEVRIWSTARSSWEIQQYMNRSLEGNENGLLMYYTFNQGIPGGSNGSTATLLDATANMYDGALTDFALTGSTSNWIARAFTRPEVQATDINAVSNGTSEVNLSWTNGSGSNRAVFMKQTSAAESPAPVDNTTYAAGSIFMTGDQVGSSGWYCVYDGNEPSVTVSGLDEDTPYRVMVCEYNVTAGTIRYNVSDSTDNPIPYVTPLPIQLASFTVTPVGETRALLRWNTVSELNNYGFTIQRHAAHESTFVDIAGVFIPGHGTTNEPQSYSHTDSSLTPGTWFYRLKQMDLDGSIHYSEGVRVTTLTGAGEIPVPTTFLLDQNYPNPFNPSTLIRYGIPHASFVRLTVYNVLGQEMARLVGEMKPAGYHQVQFNGSGLPSGVYVYRLEAGEFSATKKILLMK
jgi:hypothetical protein